MTGPVCNAGRCATLLDALAKREAGQVDRHVAQLTAVVKTFVADLDLSPEQAQRVPGALRTAVEMLLAGADRPAVGD